MARGGGSWEALTLGSPVEREGKEQGEQREPQEPGHLAGWQERARPLLRAFTTLPVYSGTQLSATTSQAQL